MESNKEVIAITPEEVNQAVESIQSRESETKAADDFFKIHCTVRFNWSW